MEAYGHPKQIQTNVFSTQAKVFATTRTLMPAQVPTSNGLDERMMSPVKRFSNISRPARPTARPPTPPMASTELTAMKGRRHIIVSLKVLSRLQWEHHM